MVAVDTNCWIAYLDGEEAEDLDIVVRAVADRTAVMVPVVLAELLSDPRLAPEIEVFLRAVPVLEPKPDFWARAGKLRASLIRAGFRPRLADTFIAQACIDQDAVLVTRDRDINLLRNRTPLQVI